ncbi:PhnB protein [Labilithrix luteola]|uniref:PhnB protein n=2 Tax=Labilithrix luteola TaxID=1391654 RepID=A0A0K1QDX6_9BACT|nr:PhnB protein [Labilithrix luteola]
MYIFRGGGYATPGQVSPTEIQAHLAKWNAWTNGLLAAGKLAAAQPLEHPPSGKTLRGRDRVVTDGPYAESKDLVSGTLVVEAASLDDAAALARDCPIFEFDGSVEIRPVLLLPGK